MARPALWLLVMVLFVFPSLFHAKLISMDESNYSKIIDSTDVVLVLFHNNWSGASSRLEQGFDDASKSIETRLRMANLDATFAFAYANGAESSGFEERFNLTKYPTFMLISDGTETEYIGLKTVDALTNFVLSEVKRFVSDRELRREREEEARQDLEMMEVEGSGEQPSNHVVTMNSANFAEVRANSDVLIVFFKVDWCPHSVRFTPFFTQASKKFARSRKTYDSSVRVVFGSLNCDENKDICARFWIKNFPTIDVFRNGEFKGGFKASNDGPQDVKDLTARVQRHVDLAIQSFKNEKELRQQLDPTKHHVIAKFAFKRSEEYRDFLRIAKALTDKCVIHDGPVNLNTGATSIEFLRQYSGKRESLPDAYLKSTAHMRYWVTERCSLELAYDSFLVAEDVEVEEVVEEGSGEKIKGDDEHEKEPEDAVEQLLLLT